MAEALAMYAGMEKKQFTVAHYWEMLKNEPKWLEPDDKGSGEQGQDEAIAGTGEASNSVDVDGDTRSPGSHIGKRPQGRDAVKEARKRSNSSSRSGSSSKY